MIRPDRHAFEPLIFITQTTNFREVPSSELSRSSGSGNALQIGFLCIVLQCSSCHFGRLLGRCLLGTIVNAAFLHQAFRFEAVVPATMARLTGERPASDTEVSCTDACVRS